MRPRLPSASWGPAGGGRRGPRDTGEERTIDSRLDAVAKAMASGSTRRRALRLAGGRLAGALLAAVGLGGRAGAQGERPRIVFCNRGAGGAVLNDPGPDNPSGAD